MSKNRFDRDIMSAEHQREIARYQQNYANAKTDAERQGWHNRAEEVRKQYSYSGGGSGDRYIPINSFNPPSIPDIPNYNSKWDNELSSALGDIKNTPSYKGQYDDRINSIINDLSNRPEYVSPYQDLMDKQLNTIMNMPEFSYDPEKDEAYQAYKKRAYRLGDQAFHNTVGEVSAQTGGRLSSWGASMSSEARNNYHIQAELAQTQYEDRQFQKYQWQINYEHQKLSTLQNADSLEFNKFQSNYNNKLNLLGSLQSLDAQKYQQYRDNIQDKKDYANFVMQLDDRDFRNYQFMVDNTWKSFQAETINFQNQMEFKKIEFQQAIERTNFNGYVNNQDSLTLGVPVGTPSKEARERIERLEDYKAQQQYEFNNYKQTQLQQFEFDKELIALKDRYANDTMDYGFQHELKELEMKFGMQAGSNIGAYSGGNSLVETATKGIGGKYVSGKVGLRSADCTGFVQEVYKQNGIDLAKELGGRFWTGNAENLVKNGKFIAVNPEDAQPGDIMWRRKGNNGHAAIYAGNGQVIEATNKNKGIVKQSAFKRKSGQNFMKAFRYVG